MLGVFIHGVVFPIATWFGGSAEGPGGPVIETEPSSVVTCAGASTGVRCRALGQGLVYRWQRETLPRLWIDIESDPRPSPTSATIITSNPDGSSSLLFGRLGLNQNGKYRCIVEDAAGAGVVSRVIFATALTGDVAGPGGVFTPDGEKDNNDLIAFIDAFFAQVPWADMGQAGGENGGDGTFDSNDFVAFVRAFFEDCFVLTNPVEPVPEFPLTPAPGFE